MAEYDILIRGGTIVDGMRTPRYPSDLAIKDGKIAKIGGLSHATANKVLDASGLIVAPGVVDLHTHYDAQIQWDPYCTYSSWHGVTSVVMGNCGFGFAPCRAEDQDRLMLTLTRNEAIPYEVLKAGMLWDWVTFPEFMNTLERVPKGVNVISYVPLTPLFVWVMGAQEAKSRRPTEAELREMCRLLDEGMDVGACGWSAQVDGPYSPQRDYDGTPMITDLMPKEELITFAKVLAERDEGFIELAYHETDPEGRYLDESSKKSYEEIAAAAKRPVIWQLVQAFPSTPEHHRSLIKWMDRCHSKGLRIYGQGETHQGGFEFTLADWNLFDTSPPWREVTLGTRAERKAKMEDSSRRPVLREEWDKGLRRINPEAGANRLEAMVVMEVANREFEEYEGMSIREMAKKTGKHPVDAMLDLAVADDLQTEFFTAVLRDDPNLTAEIVHSPHTIAGISDGGAHVRFVTFARYPTELITWLVRDEETVTLEEAHFKLSYLPAFIGGFKNRGFLREGAPADIITYDLENLKLAPEKLVHDLPGGGWRRVQGAEGYRWTLVNGEIIFEDGKDTGATPGKLLRHGVG